MKRKNKNIVIGVSTLLFATIVGSVILSSCTGNTTNSYAPYTSLSTSSSQNKIRFQTSNSESSYFNSSNTLFGDKNQNKYLSKTTIKNFYQEANKKRVEEVLKKTENWDKIKMLYSFTATEANKGKTFDEYYVKNKPQYFYGVTPTKDILDISKIYNELNVLTSVYQYASTLSTRLMTYFATMSMPLIFEDPTNNPLKPTTQSREVQNIQSLESLAAFGLSFGSGSNTYHLWPSGFTADITVDTTTASPNNENVTSGSEIMEATKTNAGDINAPFNIANIDQANKTINLPTYKLNVSNIKMNYQWYKAGRVGGSYISDISEVNNNLTNDQKNNLKKIGLTSGQISSLSYSMPLVDMQFDLAPEYYSYQDPFYPGVYNSVTTGLYNVSQPLAYSPAKPSDINFSSNEYPTSLQTKIKDNKLVNWRGIVNVSNINQLGNDNLPSGLFESIKDKKLDTIPYYQKNMIFKADTTIPPYGIKLNKTTDTEPKYLSAFNVNQLLTLFLDPYNKNSLSYVDKIVYNNVNDLAKNNFLSFWVLSWIWANPNNTQKISDLKEYKELKSALGFKNNSVDINNFYKPTNQYSDGYQKGLLAFYYMIDFANMTKGSKIEFKDNGIVETKPESSTPNEKI